RGFSTLSLGLSLERDDFPSNRHHAPTFFLEHDLFRPAFAGRSVKPNDDSCLGLRAGGKTGVHFSGSCSKRDCQLSSVPKKWRRRRDGQKSTRPKGQVKAALKRVLPFPVMLRTCGTERTTRTLPVREAPHISRPGCGVCPFASAGRDQPDLP